MHGPLGEIPTVNRYGTNSLPQRWGNDGGAFACFRLLLTNPIAIFVSYRDLRLRPSCVSDCRLGPGAMHRLANVMCPTEVQNLGLGDDILFAVDSVGHDDSIISSAETTTLTESGR